MNILLVFALKKEFSCFLEKFSEIKEEKIDDYTLYTIKHKKMNIYILHCGIGLINASISLIKTLYKIKPTFIINAGTAGGHDPSLNIGDIVLAKEAININEIKTKAKDFNEGSNSLEWELCTFLEDEEIKNFEGDIKVCYGEDKLIEKIKNILIKNKIKFVVGRAASGDIWNKEKDRIKYFNENYSTLCEEMEIYSIFKICEQEKIPSVGIKIISNNEINRQEYNTSVMKTLGEIIYTIILNLEE